MKYSAKNVTTKQTPIVGIDVIQARTAFKKEFSQEVAVPSKSVADFSIVVITLLGILNFFKF